LDINFLVKLIIFIFFLAMSAFFSSSETAFTALNKIRIRNLMERKKKKALKLQKILQNPRDLIIAILIGNNIANVAASAMATAVMLEFLKGMGLENLAIMMAIVTGIMTLLLLTFGEIIPKTLALKNPEALSLFITKPILFVLLIFKPFIILFRHISSGVSKILGISEDEADKIITYEELNTLLKISEEEGLLEKEENRMINSIFKFSDTVVREIMTPRTDAICLNINSSITDVINIIIEKGHSRLPIFEDKIDNIIGILYAKDLLTVDKDNPPQNLRKFLREANFIPESKNIEELLQQMKTAKFHMAMVVDEYGGMAGLVTLEDIIEEIIGEIQDEYDTENPPEIINLGENHYLVDARMHLEDIGDKIDYEFPEKDEYDSIGGFVLDILGHLPEKGETMEYKNLVIKATEISKRRIIKLEIIKIPEEKEVEE
jgi:putative hemolysin